MGGSGIRLATPKGEFRCDICRLNGMSSEKDLEAHKAGKIHRKREDLERRWEKAFGAITAASNSTRAHDASDSKANTAMHTASSNSALWAWLMGCACAQLCGNRQ